MYQELLKQRLINIIMKVKENVENAKKQKIFENLFNMAYEPVIVGKKVNQNNNKQYTTVFNALNNVQEHVMIKINPGVYNERLSIKKKDLKIQATQISQNSILINREYPNIVINLPCESDKVFLESLKLVNICENSSRHDIVNGSYQSIKKQDYMNFKANQFMNCCIYVKKGILQLDECKISLAAYHNRQITLPCIVVEKQGCLMLNRSEIRGGSGTIGIFSKGGKVILKQSILRDHGVAGVLMSTKNKKTVMSIKNSSFIRCNEGIVINGPFEAILQNNTVSESPETGIVICNGSKCKACNNEIRHCKIGIQIKNSCPDILKNTISNNTEWGCKIKSSGGLLCKPMIKFNTLNQNAEGGILLLGSLNNANVYSNQFHFNNNYGIKIINRAYPHVFMNKINKTLGNGVYVEKDSSVFLEKNQIESSLKCNLVLEGPNNIDNFIFRNVITKARGEGIFTIYGEKYTIKDNQITDNFNGIVSLTGVQSIEDNQIKNNQRNGILLIRDNYINISGNQIEQNKKSGIFVRDSSAGKIQENRFAKNNTQIVIENDDASFNQIQETNQFQDEYDIRIPKNYKCQLI